ncbi:MAG TPA: HAMP domain-containing sensor histidine kinase [Longimicrobiales bacterium]
MTTTPTASLAAPSQEQVADFAPAPAGRVTTVASAAAIFIGLTVLTGWVTGIEALKSIVPGLIVMIPNTASGFLLAGVSLWLMRREQPARGSALAARVCAAIVLALGLLTFLERVFGLDFGIDLLLFSQQVRNYPYLPPGQMASNSTVCFSLAGAALLLLHAEPRTSPHWREALATMGLTIASVALLGYSYGAQSLYTFDAAAGMALFTAIGFVCLHTGILFARPRRGRVTLIASSDATASFIRRLLAATIFVPVAAGWVYIQMRHLDVLSRAGGVALLMAMTIVVLIAVALTSGRALRTANLEREVLLERERQLRAVAEQAQAEAETANHAKSNFLATMSHELRTPLNAIIGYASLMSEGVTGPLTEAQQQQLDRVRLSAQHLLSLIDQILGLSRLEAGKDKVALRDVHLPWLVQETTVIAEPLFLKRQIRFVVDPPPPIMLKTDPDRVRQILLNLIGNAVKFSEDGDIRLRVLHDRERGTARFEVSDAGIGIAPEHTERIFEPFWQVEMNTTRRHQGAGLGLSVSRQLARLLHGDLTVTSTPGAGSTFVLELPA